MVALELPAHTADLNVRPPGRTVGERAVGISMRGDSSCWRVESPSQVCHAGLWRTALSKGPSCFQARPSWQGPGMAVAASPSSSSQAGPLLRPVITAGRFVGASGKGDTSSTSSPGFLQQLARCAACGEREAPGPVTRSPPRREAGEVEGAGWSWLDWLSLGGEDRMSFLARSPPWKTGTGEEVRYTRGRALGVPVGAPVSLEHPDPLLGPLTLSPGFTGMSRAAVAATWREQHAGISGAGAGPQLLGLALPPRPGFLPAAELSFLVFLGKAV